MLTVLTGDCLERLRELPDASVQCCVTSPSYWGLRDYGCAGQLGLEKSPNEYVANMVQVFREVRRALKDDGTCWLNLGDSYCASPKGNLNGQDKSGLTSMRTQEHSPAGIDKRATFRRDRAECGVIHRKPADGLKPKDLVGIPWLVAFALRLDGWYLRQDIIWAKPNPMPESVRDRCTKGHEYIFLLSKSPRYFYDAEAISEDSTYSPGCGWDDAGHEIAFKTSSTSNPAFRAIKETRNKRSVWTVATTPFKDAHFATFPPDLIKPCILAGSKAGDVVLDPFGGSGTTGMVALELGRKALLIELNPEYVKLIHQRCDVTPGLPLVA